MPRADNSGNLTPNDQRTPEELKRMGAKGGKASAEARKRKKATRDLARQVLALQPKASKKAKRAIEAMGYDAEAEGAPTVELMGLCAIAQMYMAGDIAAAQFLYSYAQVPDMRAALEREKIKTAKKITQSAPLDVEDLSPLAELLEGEGEAAQT